LMSGAHAENGVERRRHTLRCLWMVAPSRLNRSELEDGLVPNNFHPCRATA
jgi:hypothetical protein